MKPSVRLQIRLIRFCRAEGRTLLFLLFVLPPLFSYRPALALAPDEVAVLANTRVAGSLELAREYMAARHIPAENLIRLQTVTSETCTRDEYNRAMEKPVRAFLQKRIMANKRPRIHCLVLVHGMPLKIAATDKDETTRAAVDSEISLVLSEGHPISGWVPNPYFLGFRDRGGPNVPQRDKVLMVSRLDGPDLATARRLFRDSLATERTGLRGLACFDARWPEPEGKKLSGYALYDASLHRTARIIRKSGRMRVRLEASEALFGQGACPDTALYCGWYSLGNYVDAFTWARGAIGFHIASGECATLKNKSNNGWCRQILAHGASATIGPVYEPYVQGFPLPELFFGQLVEGYLSLGESFLVSLPYLSWQVILIGDPLYQPFSPLPDREKIP